MFLEQHCSGSLDGTQQSLYLWFAPVVETSEKQNKKNNLIQSMLHMQISFNESWDANIPLK